MLGAGQGHPRQSWGEVESLDVQVDVLPVPVSLFPGTTGTEGAAARSQHPHRRPPAPARMPVPRPWLGRSSEHPQAVPAAEKGQGPVGGGRRGQGAGLT